MALSQEQLRKARDIVEDFPDDKKSAFKERFKTASETTKEVALTKLLGQFEGKDIPTFQGEIKQTPPLMERLASGAFKALPSALQTAGGFIGGAVGGRVGKPGLGGAIGGTGARGIGILIQEAIDQMRTGSDADKARLATLGPFVGTIANMKPANKAAFGREILKTGAIEGAFGAAAKPLRSLAEHTGKSLMGTLIGPRTAERGFERGFKTILDPELYKNRITKEVALKSKGFLSKVKNVTGRKVSDAVNRPGVGDKLAPVSDIKTSVGALTQKHGLIKDFDASPAQKKIMNKFTKEILAIDENTTIAQLWDRRKGFDLKRFEKSFSREATDYLDDLRDILNNPIKGASEEVAESFSRYSSALNISKELEKDFKVHVLDGETFASSVESFSSRIFGTTKDEQVRLLKQLDSYLAADDKVIEQLLDAGAAETIQRGGVGVTLPGKILAGLLGGRKAIAGVGAAAQSTPVRATRATVGRSFPVATSEISAGLDRDADQRAQNQPLQLTR